MEEKLFISKCTGCGAYTVQLETGDNSISMSPELFNKHFPGVSVDQETCNCNHCVNHWGIDLCACGSGEHYTTCSENLPVCGKPYQELGDIYVKRQPVFFRF